MSDGRLEITDALLDRLVDGQLDVPERRELLLALDAEASGWRRCALAFLEAQAWRSEMRRLVAAGEDAAASAPVPLFNEVATPSAPTAGTSPASDRGRHAASWWLALAASVVVAFGIGRQWGAALAPDGAQVAGVPPSEEPRANDDVPAAPESGDAVTLVVNDPQGRPQRVSVPLVEARDLGSQFADRPGWSSAPGLARQLDEHGLALTARRRYAPLYFEQQNQVVPMIVPVDDAVVLPAVRPVY